MKKWLCALSLLLAAFGWLGAQGAGLAFRSDADVRRAMAEYVISGKAPISNSFVFTGDELAEIIDYGGRVGPSSLGFKRRLIFSIAPAITGVSGLDAYGDSISGDPTALYFIDSLPLFLEFGAAFHAGNGIAGKVKLDLSMRQDWFGENATSLVAPWDISSVFNLLMADSHFPQESWVTAGGGRSWLAIGRFKAGIGDGHFGNTMLNSRAEWYDQVQGAVGDRNFRFMYMLSSSATHLYDAEGAIQFRENADGARYRWDPLNDHDSVTAMEAGKVFAYSQIEARFWDKLRVGVAQMNLIGGKDPNLLDVLPVTFWHNAYTAGFTNVMLNLNASLVPFDGLKVFGEFTLDDIRDRDEGEASKPFQYAWQTGGSYSFKPTGSLIVTLGGEYSFTSEWVYCRWQPYLTMYQRHMLSGGYSGTDWPLGFAYGPDARHLGLYLDASLPSGLRFELGYEYLEKGPIYMGMTYYDGASGTYLPIYYDADPSVLDDILAEPDQLSHGFSLSVTLPLPMGFTFDVRTQVWLHDNYQNIENNGKQVLLYSAGVQWRY
ncbi:MAG TPA: hypothetical protein VN445_11235 [Rectinemataceae bacterium]|nr:hypothetical protein [Rectinemataceae bacterium]